MTIQPHEHCKTIFIYIVNTNVSYPSPELKLTSFLLMVQNHELHTSRACLHHNTIAQLCFIKTISPVHQKNGTKWSLKNTMSHFGDHLLLQSRHSFKMLLNCFHLLKVLSNILFVLITLLLFHLCHFILQLNDGSLNLIVLTNEGHPAAEIQAETSTKCI